MRFCFLLMNKVVCEQATPEADVLQTAMVTSAPNVPHAQAAKIHKRKRKNTEVK